MGRRSTFAKNRWRGSMHCDVYRKGPSLDKSSLRNGTIETCCKSCRLSRWGMKQWTHTNSDLQDCTQSTAAGILFNTSVQVCVVSPRCRRCLVAATETMHPPCALCTGAGILQKPLLGQRASNFPRRPSCRST